MPGKPLTRPEAQPDSSEEMVGKFFMVPHSQLNTSILQILCVKAIIHNGVIEHRVWVSLYHSGLLVTLLTGVRKHVALRGEKTQHVAWNVTRDVSCSYKVPRSNRASVLKTGGTECQHEKSLQI